MRFNRKQWYRKIARKIEAEGTLAFKQGLAPTFERRYQWVKEELLKTSGITMSEESARVKLLEEKHWCELFSAVIPDNAKPKTAANKLVNLLKDRDDLRPLMEKYLNGEVRI